MQAKKNHHDLAAINPPCSGYVLGGETEPAPALAPSQGSCRVLPRVYLCFGGARQCGCNSTAQVQK